MCAKIENQSSLTWKIQVSSNGSSGWTDVNSYSPAGSTGTDWEKFSADLSQHTNVYVRLYYTGNGTAGAIDDIVLTTATATVPVTVSEYGYSTFCCHRALDFTNSNINVYYATAEGTTLTFHKITQLPPDTGVLLQKAGGTTEEVPAYVGTTLTKPSGNVFVPGTDNVVTWTENDMNYILYHGAFYQADENRVATNRAYIHLPVTANPVKSFEINLDDPTGIEAIENGQLTIDNEIYNLAGQRLSKMQKGINIVNGKKILF